MTQSQYLILAHDQNCVDACVLDELKGIECEWELHEGVSQIAKFPKGVTFTMHPDYPYNTVLTDSLRNTDLVFVASLRLKDFLEARALSDVEYLRVTVIDHKCRTASRNFYIIHPINPVDCLDIDKCEVKWSKIDSKDISSLRHLVLDESKLNPQRALFRPKYFCQVILVERNLAESIDREGFTGIRWIELKDYPE